jgi:hypothetical protein
MRSPQIYLPGALSIAYDVLLANAHSILNLTSVRRLKEKLQRLPQIISCLLNTIPLAGNIQLWAERHLSIFLALNNCGQLYLLYAFSAPLIYQSSSLQIDVLSLYPTF